MEHQYYISTIIFGSTTLLLFALFLCRVRKIGNLIDIIRQLKHPKEFTNIFQCLGYQAETVKQFRNQNQYLLRRLETHNDYEAHFLRSHIEEKINRNNDFILVITKRLDF